ncbi:MAG: DUF547 domain-containing protein [Bacteroidota bacterium]
METPIRLFLIFIALFWIENTAAQTIDQQFFDEVNTLFQNNVENGLITYDKLVEDHQFQALIRKVENADLSNANPETRKAFLINAYNLQVINNVLDSYPLNSVQDIPGFFDKKKIKVGGETMTLSDLENNLILKAFNDPRLHFVLVCAAVDCPPITNFAYSPLSLDQQLDNQTRLAINDQNFIKVNGSQVQLSEIFRWYAKDFGSSKKAIIDYLNEYRGEYISEDAKVSYYQYDWTLNDVNNSTVDVTGNNPTGTNASRYVVSSTINNGSFEVKIFNNLYTQRTGDGTNLTDRSTFFTTSFSALYGLSNRLNIGVVGRYRRVKNEPLPSSPFGVFSGSSNNENQSFRQGFTAIGPQIRYAPVEKWENFSIQSSFVFPIGNDLAGSDTQPYIDWTGPTWHTQFFNDFPIGNNFSFFTEIDFLWEDIGQSADGHINRISTPATLIFSYIPTKKITLYGLGGFSPYWQKDFDYFIQAGIGAKYQFTPNFELELLFTDFTSQFLRENGGQANTYNVGIRFNL